MAANRGRSHRDRGVSCLVGNMRIWLDAGLDKVGWTGVLSIAIIRLG